MLLGSRSKSARSRPISAPTLPKSSPTSIWMRPCSVSVSPSLSPLPPRSPSPSVPCVSAQTPWPPAELRSHHPRSFSKPPPFLPAPRRLRRRAPQPAHRSSLPRAASRCRPCTTARALCRYGPSLAWLGRLDRSRPKPNSPAAAHGPVVATAGDPVA